VICTIHQPSRMVLEAFDYMLLLKRGGQLPLSPSPEPSSSQSRLHLMAWSVTTVLW
jgi:hypothetical protein